MRYSGWRVAHARCVTGSSVALAQGPATPSYPLQGLWHARPGVCTRRCRERCRPSWDDLCSIQAPGEHRGGYGDGGCGEGSEAAAVWVATACQPTAHSERAERGRWHRCCPLAPGLSGPARTRCAQRRASDRRCLCERDGGGDERRGRACGPRHHPAPWCRRLGSCLQALPPRHPRRAHGGGRLCGRRLWPAPGRRRLSRSARLEGGWHRH
mmetsp:Transcript_38414/g.101272  ORF Transcript_38414/g.101272 Transcript_38414/m.101272 type:complete len:211 (+) Transcript_38414:760-1392(+)